jgi:tRNA threonylcarbamoyladenosine biosynthesis protein TsaB
VITLAIDASTYTGTVAVLRDSHVLADGEAAMRGRDSEALMPCVAEILRRAGVAPTELNRVVCGAGPGSFTSLRIAASIAKGLAFGSGCPLFAVSSLALVLAGEGLPPAGRYVTALDALRGEVYVEAFTVDESGDVDVIPTENIVTQNELAPMADSLCAALVGPGQTAFRRPRVGGISALERLIVPADLSTWEPNYGRKAEAQARWEAAHQRPLPSR